MSERSPMLERIAQEEEKKKKEEKRARFRKIAEKVAIGGALIGTLTAGTVGYEKYVAPHNEKIMKDFDANAEKKLKEENAFQELVSDPRTGYVDLDHYLEDYPEIKQNQEQLEEARRYFVTREEK